MKTLLCTCFLGGLLVVNCSIVVAQVSNTSPQRPTYQTIQPIQPVQLKTAPPKTLLIQAGDPFENIGTSPVYIVDGKEVTNKAEFMRQLKQAKSGQVVVSLPNGQPKQTIAVSYSTRKLNLIKNSN